MILTALGYDATAYQLVGADWAINTTFFATRNCKPSLYEGLNKINMNAAITRDTAAQMIWNGMQNVYVEYTPTLQVTGGSLSHGYGPNDANETLLEQSYDAHITKAKFTGNKNTASLKDGQIQVTLDAQSVAGTANASKTITADMDIAHLGETVKVIWKNNKDSASTLDSKDKIYGVYPTGETETVHATLADVSELKSDKYKIKVDGTEYDVDDTNGVKVYTNYVLTKTYTKTSNFGGNTDDLKGKDADSPSKLSTDLAKTKGDSIKLVLDDGKVNTIYIVESKLGVVTSKNSEKVFINNGVGSIEIAKNEVYEGIAKDDVVVTTELYTGSNKLVIVEKAETVSGSVKGFKTTSKTAADGTTTYTYENVTLDGTTYKIYDKAAMTTTGMPTGNIASFADTNIGEDFDLYMVNGFVAGAVQTSETANNYSLVIDVKQGGTAGATFDALQVQLLAADGTKSIYTVSKDSDDADSNGVTQADYPVGTLVTYTIDKDGNAKLKYADTINKAYSASDTSFASAGYVKKTKTFDSKPTTEDCVLFVSTKGTPTSSDYKAYKIRDLKDVDLNGKAGQIALNTDNEVVAVFLAKEGKPNGVTDSKVYGIVKSAEGTVKPDSTSYNRYIVSVNGEDMTVDIDANGTNNGAASATLTEGDVVSFEPTSDGTYSNAAAFTTLSTDVTGAAGTGTVAVGYGKSYNEKDGLISIFLGTTGTKPNIAGDTSKIFNAVLDDDVEYYFIDKKDKESYTDGAVNDSFDTIEGYKNIILVGKWDGGTPNVFEVSAVISEISGEKSF